MSDFVNLIRDASDGALNGVSDGIILALGVVAVLLIIMSIIAFLVSAFLSIAYIKYNRKKNSLGATGEQIARSILDNNGLNNIKVKSTGSIMFGNSYSHYFKKVRLRRLTWKKKSVTSLAMAAQKSSLAILDKENDPDMKKRIKMTPIIYFGPLAFIPLIIIGALIDIVVLDNQNATCTIIATVFGLAVYIVSFVMSILVLKTEKKAQDKAIDVMKNEGLANETEIEMCKKLFKLYNIEYVNNMIIALLELIYRILQILSYFQGSSSSSKK